MISDIIKPENNFNYYLSTLGIKDSTLDYFKEQLTIKKTKHDNLLPCFMFITLDNKNHFELPLNYTDIDNLDFDNNNFFLLKLDLSASITYFFDSPIEMLYYYQIYSSKINSTHQFICFLNTINNQGITKLLDLVKGTRIRTVFNKINTIGNINDIRFALLKNNIEFVLLKNQNDIVITIKDQEYRLYKNKVLLHEFEKLTKIRSFNKTIKPPVNFNNFKEIILS